MKAVGITLIAAGILMYFYTSVNFAQKKKMAALGSIEMSRVENKDLAWPVLAGVGIGLMGVALVLVSARKHVHV